jgi:hypothetical protein
MYNFKTILTDLNNGNCSDSNLNERLGKIIFELNQSKGCDPFNADELNKKIIGKIRSDLSADECSLLFVHIQRINNRSLNLSGDDPWQHSQSVFSTLDMRLSQLDQAILQIRSSDQKYESSISFRESLLKIGSKEIELGLEEYGFSKSIIQMHDSYANKTNITLEKSLAAKNVAKKIADVSSDFIDRGNYNAVSVKEFRTGLEGACAQVDESCLKQSRTLGRKALNFTLVLISVPLLGIPVGIKKLLTGSALMRSDGGSKLKEMKNTKNIFLAKIGAKSISSNPTDSRISRL